jgi:hypothetical protein
MQGISLHWPGHALKTNNNMWDNSIEIIKNKLECVGADS